MAQTQKHAICDSRQKKPPTLNASEALIYKLMLRICNELQELDTIPKVRMQMHHLQLQDRAVV